MTTHYEYDAEEQTITIRPKGMIGLSDILEYVTAVGEDPNVGAVKFEIIFFKK